MTIDTKAPTTTPQFIAELQRLDATRLRFVIEALRDGAITAEQDAQAFCDDTAGTNARIRVLDELWNRLASDVNARLGHAQAAD